MSKRKVVKMRQRIKGLLERVLNAHIIRTLPRGISLHEDLINYLPAVPMNVIFDVGANVGQSTLKYLDRFPNAEIYSFEPAKDTFSELCRKTAGIRRIRNYQMALGAMTQEGQMVIHHKLSTMNYLTTNEHVNKGDQTSDFEPIVIQKLDEFCQTERVGHINFLKIDTEGSDLDVLKGADLMLGNHDIDIVEVEAGMNPQNDYHAPFEQLKMALESKDYYLFAIYEQVGEWPTKQPHLRRANPVFISGSVIASHSG